MAAHLIRRLVQLPLLLLVVSAIVFVALRLGPGSPVDLATEAARDPAEIERIRHDWGLDRPLYVQYADYIVNVLHGDFGRSFFGDTPVADVIAERLPATLELAVVGMLLGTCLGVLLGTISAVSERTPLDLLTRVFALVGISFPTFWIGLMGIGLFAVQLGWVPVGGRFDARLPIERITGFVLLDALLTGNFDAAGIALQHLVLPATVVGLFVTAFIARITRATVLEALHDDYIRTARAKGLPSHVIVIRHGLRNALLPILTIIGLQFGNLLGGAAVTETVFSWPGLGKLMIDAINQHDFPQVQASVLLLATSYVIVNLMVDVVYAVVDPRIRHG
jgi:peptide/nickel transport system permease protein